MKVIDEVNIDKHNKTEQELMNLSKDEIYKAAGVEPKEEDIKSKQILALFQNKNIIEFVKQLYLDGKSHSSIAKLLNNIGKEKFTPHPKTQAIPTIKPSYVLKLCKDNKICTEMRSKNLTKKQLEAKKTQNK